MMHDLSRELNFLYEIGSLRHVQRTWASFGGGNFANTAEHSLRVVWLSMIIAKYEGANIDRTIKIALVHDISETRVGDKNYVTKMYNSENSKDAMHDIANATKIGDDILDFWNEYKERVTLEARIVKDADNLDCDIELREQKLLGNQLANALEETRTAVHQLLFTKTARELYNMINASDPNAWHKEASNRFNKGDWRK